MTDKEQKEGTHPGVRQYVWYPYCTPPRYGTADLSHLETIQVAWMHNQRIKHILSQFHVKPDKNANLLVFFLSKKTKFSLFPSSEVLRPNAHVCHVEILGLGRHFKSAYPEQCSLRTGPGPTHQLAFGVEFCTQPLKWHVEAKEKWQNILNT